MIFCTDQTQWLQKENQNITKNLLLRIMTFKIDDLFQFADSVWGINSFQKT